MNSENQNSQYTVVARRYRPQMFTDLVGQGHISTALSNAIKQNRVGHAYLFTGARGVGKTSSARIFAKCLNCEKGPATEPCNECDICEAVSVGEDVDVLEIDGASNRGIDEIRQLRSNTGVRPSRSRFKIYIIDEVHMLTQQAFNALLKTLEEPPSHVKFIFCTTDPQKIPITVLSRCQRFDFSPVQTDEIAKRLKEIAENEGVNAADEALALLARRANGSMRDSQSLLEQLFSFCGEDITVDEVHQLLGTADISRIAELAATMTSGDAAASLGLVHKAVTDGVDAGQLTQQLLGYYRDMMAVRVGCGSETLLSCTASDQDDLKKLSDQLGLDTILTTVQLLDGTVVRMQSSVHTRTLLEVAVVRICNLENLDSISELVQALNSGGIANVNTASKKNGRVSKISFAQNSGTVEPVTSSSLGASFAAAKAAENPVVASVDEPPMPTAVGTSSSSASETNVVTKSPQKGSQSASASPSGQTLNATQIKTFWEQTLDDLSDMTADMAREYEKLQMTAPNKLAVTLKDSYNRDMCSRPERKQKLETAFSKVSGQQIRIDFLLSTNPKAQRQAPEPKMTRRAQIQKLNETPIVKKAMEVFDAEIIDFRASNKKS